MLKQYTIVDIAEGIQNKAQWVYAIINYYLQWSFIESLFLVLIFKVDDDEDYIIFWYLTTTGQ